MLRSLVVVIKRPVKKVFRTFPPLERVARALLRRFPSLASAYRRSNMPPSGLDTAAGSTWMSAEASVRKIALSPHASTIYRDLALEIERQRLKSIDTSSAKRPL